MLEAGRDLGASPFATFRRVTLPLSRQAILAGLVIVSLPMFGDYFTNNLLGSTKTSMYGNLIDNAVTSPGGAPQAASLAIILMVLLIIPLWYYLRATQRGLEAGMSDRRRGVSADGCSNPWRKPGLPRNGHVGVHRLVDPARRHRDRVLVQRRALAERLAGILVPVVGRNRVGAGIAALLAVASARRSSRACASRSSRR